MKAEAIPYHQTKHFSQFILKYISGDTSLRALYNRTPSIESFKEQILEKKSQNFNRNALVTSLVDQYLGTINRSRKYFYCCYRSPVVHIYGTSVFFV